MNSFFVSAFFFIVTLNFTAHAATQQFISGETLAKTNVSAMQINGKITRATSEQNGDKTTFKVKPESIETGMEMRDRHMREKIFKSTDGSLSELAFTIEKFDFKKIPDTFDATGSLSIRGNPQVSTWNCKKETSSTEATVVHCSTKILLSKYSIDRPKYMGVAVQDEVDASVKWKIIP